MLFGNTDYTTQLQIICVTEQINELDLFLNEIFLDLMNTLGSKKAFGHCILRSNACVQVLFAQRLKES